MQLQHRPDLLRLRYDSSPSYYPTKLKPLLTARCLAILGDMPSPLVQIPVNGCWKCKYISCSELSRSSMTISVRPLVTL